MSLNIAQLIKTPLKQKNNRVWRTYTGGAMIDHWKQAGSEEDNDLPEEWIMSTVTARGNDRPLDEGLSILEAGGQTIALKALLEHNKEAFLGKAHAEKFGTTGVLIKMLDSKERLTIQVHPDKEYALKHLNSAFGKTESWYILGGREIDGVKPSIYMGFKEHVTPELWKDLFLSQDIEGMLDCLHRFEVAPGDAFMIYGGVPHAIGSGCFLLEVQEPTDFTMRVEKITPGGLKIGDELIHQGVGNETMLQCFKYDTCSFEEAAKRWKVTPEVIDESNAHTLKNVFDRQHTDCFGLKELDLTGEHTVKGNGIFWVGVVYSGSGTMSCGGQVYEYNQGDEIFFPAGIDEVTFKADVASKVLLCYPPK